MFETILIANRGEIACRVIRTARALGFRTIAVYSDADATAPHVSLADDAAWIGPSPVSESYLSGDRILEAAKATGAQAIHPGYGFLSENADFARAVAAAGLVFIGAPADAIEAMGNKAGAKRLMIAAGVPCVPGYEGADQSPGVFADAAQKIGFPVMIKAAAGGGGRGMREVTRAQDMPDALALARSEAENAFGSGELILEKSIPNPRHVEVQVFADDFGTTLHLGERDCSIQRRHQKVFEEAPCPVMTTELRAAMTKAAIDAAQAVAYRGAGTVEFLLDPSGAFYFLEMNTRLQVEHPVTEAVTGLDLVELQLLVAQGKPLPITQDDVTLTGHAIEARLYAENPSADFMPTTGPIALWEPCDLPGLRTDAGIETGGEVSPLYDSMLAKVIAHGPSREVAIRRLKRGLSETRLLGVATNRGFLIDALGQPAFASDDVGTGFINEVYPEGVHAAAPDFADFALTAAILHMCARQAAFEAAPTQAEETLGWSSAEPLPHIVTLSCGDERRDLSILAQADSLTISGGDDAVGIRIGHIGPHDATLFLDGAKEPVSFALVDETRIAVARGSRDMVFDIFDPLAATDAAAGESRIVAPMPGLVISTHVTPGEAVDKDQTLAVMEAMKMQHQIKAPRAGIVEKVEVSDGDQLKAGAIMFELEVET